MRSILGLTEALPSLVESKFKAAKSSGGLIFSPTELALIRTSTGVPFQLRYCPALGKKPKPQKDKAAPSKKSDPFEKPDPELLVADVPTADPTHLLVLNKFPVIANHFILATKTNKQQTHILEQDDLEITYACLKAWKDGEARGRNRRLFAFFNSGEHSGASQPHRHLQFLPVESMKDEEHASEWDLLTDLILSGLPLSGDDKTTDIDANVSERPHEVLQHYAIPFTHFGIRLPADPSGDFLMSAYQSLLQEAKKAVNEFIATRSDDLSLHATEDGSLPISYNMAMTTSGMAIVPRRSEGSMLKREDSTDVGYIELNGTTLGGTLMVKNQAEWDLLRTEPGKLDNILNDIGIPFRSKL
ncbi:HIT-like protein [Lophiostoma macrostomum CBS 122681]|uniref:HIT-like protein n=1 Tax=Lophiostoma macrostomum CBS 122681 TaxID=1314788 RepID=A0A6A6THW1_9PLEO|nr:HIT-like protein [Lophiostoma macrostomum CBS 122681]